MLTLAVQKRYKQFHGNTGGIVGNAASYALRLARAYEAAHDDETLEYVWDNDQDADTSWMDEQALADYQAGDTVILQCALIRKCEGGHGVECRHSEYLASLGGIAVGPSDDFYRMLVEAELADEAGVV